MSDIEREGVPLLSDSDSQHSTIPSSPPSPGVRSLDGAQLRALDSDILLEPSPLGRTLTRSSAYILVISHVIGSGIFATPGAILRGVGSPGLALLLWVVGALAAGCALAVGLEFGSMLPRSGGEKVYLEFTYRRPRFLASTLVALQVVLLGFTASNCVVFSQYMLFALDVVEPSEWLRRGVAVGLLTAVTIMHGWSKRIGVAVQNVLGWIKIALIGFMILSGLYVVILFRQDNSRDEQQRVSKVRQDQRNISSVWDGIWAGSNWNWGVNSTALFKVFYSYAGLENANNVMNEVKDPIRTLRVITLSALTAACVLYLLVNIAYFLVIPLDRIRNGGELVAALYFEAIFGPTVGGKLLSFAVALSAAGNVMVVMFALARVKQEIARQGFLPFSALLSSTKPFGTPLGGFLVHYIPSFLVIVLPPSREVYSFILEVEGYPGQIFALAVSLGLLWLRYKRPDLKRPFKAWIPAVLLRVALSVALLFAPFFPPKERSEGSIFHATYAIVGVSIIVFGIIYWYIWTVLVPRVRGYSLEEEAAILDDGTSITKLVHVPRKAQHLVEAT